MNGGPYTPWLTGATETAATFTGKPGTRYRFRVRATDKLGSVSEFAVSDEIGVDPLPAVGPGSSGRPHDRLDPRLSLKKSVRRGRTIHVTARIAGGASGSVTLELKAKAGKRRIYRRAKLRRASERMSADIRLPGTAQPLRGATLTLRYRGDARYRGATVTRKSDRL